MPTRKFQGLTVQKVKKTQLESKNGYEIKHETVFANKEDGIKVSVTTKGADGALGFSKGDNVNIIIDVENSTLIVGEDTEYDKTGGEGNELGQ